MDRKEKKATNVRRRVYRPCQLDAVQSVVSISINGMDLIENTKTRTKNKIA